MLRSKKWSIALCATIIAVCAAVWLAVVPQARRADADISDAGNYESLIVDTSALSGADIYAGGLDELKEYISVTASDSDGGGVLLGAEDYTLSLEEGGTLTANADNTVVVTLNGGTATGTFSVNNVQPSQGAIVPTRIALDRLDGISSTTLQSQIRRAIRGAIYFSDGNSYPLTSYKDSAGYSDSIPDILPTAQEAAAGTAYTREIFVSYQSNGVAVKSNIVTVEVTWVKPESLSVTDTSLLWVTAGTTIEAGAFDVRVEYADGSDRDLSAGEYTYRYQNGEDISYNDTGVYIVYTEGNETIEEFVSFEDWYIDINEEPVIPPELSAASSFTVEYDTEVQRWEFINYNSVYSSFTVSSELLDSRIDNSAHTATFSATAAGTYTVTFTANSGFAFQSIPMGAEATYEGEGDESIIRSLTFTLTIEQAELSEINFEMPDYNGDSIMWPYDGTTEGHMPENPSATGVDGDEINFDTYGTGGNAVTMAYEYTSADGETTYSGMPTDAGAYRVRLKLSGLANYEDGASGWVYFTITSSEVELPELAEYSFTYTGSVIAPEITHNVPSWSSLYEVSGDTGATNRGTYKITFRLLNSANYSWADDEDVDGDTFTLDWEITTAENSISVTVDDWTYTAYAGMGNQPVPVIKFTNEGVQPEYHYFYSAWGSSDYTEIIPDDSYVWQAGNYRVYAAYPADNSGYGNFSAAQSQTVSFTVYRAQISAPALSSQTSVYSPDGNTNSVVGFADTDGAGNRYFTALSGEGLSFSGGNITAVGAGGVVAGRYTITVTLGSNYCTDSADREDTTVAYDLTWNISRLGVEKPNGVQSYTYEPETYYNYVLVDGFAPYSVVSGSRTYAGIYDAEFELNANYCWGASGSGDTANFTLVDGLIINRATVDKPVMDITAGTYTGSAQSVTAAGYDSSLMSFTASAAESGDGITYSVSGSAVTFTATNAGSYTIVFRLTDTDNYTWTDGETAPDGADAQPVEFGWTIQKADNEVLGEDTFAGWAFGETPTSVDSLNISARLDDEYLKPEFAYYAEADTSYSNPIDISATTDVGDYVLRVTVPAGDNTNAAYRYYSFSITQNSAVISGAAIENVSGWTYGDVPHALSFTVTVGDTDITAVAQVEYFTSGWGSGETTVGSSLASSANAGNYRVVISVDGNDNYIGAQTEIPFTINKLPVAVPVVSGGYNDAGRYFVYDNGSPLFPTVQSDEDVYSVEFGTENSSGYGNYTVIVTLLYPENYEWDESTNTNAGANTGETLRDSIDGATLTMWYRITRSQYEFEVQISGWEYGTFSEDSNSPSIKDYDSLPQEIKEAQVTYQYYLEGDTAFENPLAGRPAEVGNYVVRATIAETTNYASVSASAPFEITAASLTVTATGYSGTYDAAAHDVLNGISVNAVNDSGEQVAAVEYKLEFYVNGGWTETMPQITNAAQGITYTFRITGVANHKEFSGTFTASVARLDVAVGWSAPETFTYNGENQISLVTAAVSLLAADGGDTNLTVFVSGGGTFCNAGSYVLEADISDYTANYNITAHTQDYIIGRLAVFIEAADGTSVFGEQLHPQWQYAEDSETTFVAEDGISVSAGIESASTYNAGTYRTYISGISAENGALINYTVNGVDGEEFEGYADEVNAGYDGTWTVTARPVTVSVSSAPDEYSGREQQVTLSVGGVDGNAASGAVEGHEPRFDLSYDWTGHNGYSGESLSAVLNAGDYTVTVTLSGQNYKIVNAEGKEIANITYEFTVYPHTVTIEWAEDDFTYNGEDQTGSITAHYESFESEVVSLDIEITSDESPFMNAGSYTFAASFAAGDNTYGNYALPEDNTAGYLMKQCAITLIIADVGVVYGNAGALGYTGYSGGYTGIDVSGFTNYLALYTAAQDGEFIAAGSYAGLDAGTYYIIGKDSDEGIAANFDITFVGQSGETYGVYSVSRAEITVTYSMPDNLTYDGTEKDIDITVTTVGLPDDVDIVKTYYTYENDILGSAIEGAPVDAGRYLLKVTANNNNYSVNFVDTAFNVTPAAITADNVHITPYAGDYDGDYHYVATGYSVETVNNQTAEWTFSLDGNNYYEIEDAAVMLKDVNISGGEVAAYTVYYRISAPNHTQYENSFEVTITRISVDAVWNVPELVYDGTDQAGEIFAHYVNANGEEIALSVSASGVLKNVGDTVTFTASFSAGDTGSFNYELGSFTKDDYAVSPAEVTVTLTPVSRTYTGGDFAGNSFSAEYTDINGAVIQGDDLGVTVTVSVSAVNAGSYAVEPAWANANYDVTFIGSDSAFVITNAEITDVSLDGENFGYTYSGSSYFDTVVAGASAVTADNCDAEWTFSLAEGTEGGYTETVDLTDVCRDGGAVVAYTVFFRLTAENHDIYYGSFTVTINPYEVDAVWAEDNFVYDGSDQSGAIYATYTPLAADSSSPVALAVSGGEFTDVNADGYEFTASFAGNDALSSNYILKAETTSATFHMQKADLVWQTQFAWIDSGNSSYAWIYGDEDFEENRISPMAALATNSGYTITESGYEGTAAGITVEYFLDEECRTPCSQPFTRWTDAGIYYAKVTVASTINYGSAGSDFGDLVAIISFEVEQDTVTATWEYDSFAYDGLIKTNTLSFDTSIMRVKSHSGDGEYEFMQNDGLITMVASLNGEYIVVMELIDDNYKWAYNDMHGIDSRELGIMWSIADAENQWILNGDGEAISIVSWTYGQFDESINLPAATALYGTVEFYYIERTDDYPPTAADLASLTSIVPSDAGTYWVVARVRQSASYSGLWATAPFEIYKASVDAPVMPHGTWTYTGGPLSVTLGAGNGLDLTIMAISSMSTGLSASADGPSRVFSAVDADNYRIDIVLTNPNYEWAESAEATDGVVTLTWEITAAPNSWEKELTIGNWTYGGQPLQPEAQALYGEAEFTYYEYVNSAYQQTDAPDMYTAAGTYYVVASVEASGNYGYLTSGYVEFEILPAEYDLTGITWSNTVAEYSGLPQKPVAGNLPEGLDGITLEYAVESVTEAGKYKLTVTFTTASPNYNAPGSIQVDFEITSRVVEITWSADNFTYNGEDRSGEITASYTDVNGDSHALVVTAEGEFITVREGGYVFTATFAAGDGANYKLPADNTAVYHMRAAEVVVSISDQSAGYTGENLALTLNNDAYEITYGEVYGEDDLGITLAISSGEAVNAGTYIIDGSASNKNYSVSFAQGVFTITGREVEIDIIPGGGVYGGEIAAASAQVVGEGADLEFIITYTGTANDGTAYVNSTAVPTQAGTYTVRVAIADTNYSVAGADVATMIIARAYVELPELDSKQFKGEPLTADIAASVLYTVSQGDDWIDVGEYEVTFTLTDSAANNYRWESADGNSAVAIFAVTRADNNVTTPVVKAEYTYGETVSPGGSVADFGTVYYVYSKDENGTDYNSAVPTEVGRYYVRAAVAGTANYFGATSEHAAVFEIVRAEIALPYLSQESSVYSGAIQTNLLAGYDGASMTVNLGSLAAAQTADGLELYAVDVGVYEITLSLINSGNYVWAGGEDVVTLTWEITAAPNSWEKELTIGNWAYGGQPLQPEAQALYGEAEFTYYEYVNSAYQQTDAPDMYTAAGTYYVVASVEASGNYGYLTSGYVEFEILPAEYDLTGITWSNTVAEYSGLPQKPVAGNLPEGLDGITLEYAVESVTEAGKYKLTVTFTTASPNYNAPGSIQVDFEITSRVVEIEITPGGGVYGGEIAAASAQVVGGGADLEFIITYTGTANDGTAYVNSTAVPTQAGTYTVRVAIADANYSLAGENTAIMLISRAEVSEPSAGSKTYTGEPLTADIAASALYTVSQGANWINAGTYPVTLTLTDSYNYCWSGTGGRTSVTYFSILRADNFVTAPEVEEIYNYGTAIEPSGSEALHGTVYYVFSADENFAVYSAQAPSEAGTYYVRAMVDATLNYSGCASEIVRFEIIRAVVSVPELDFGSSVYTGSAQYNAILGADLSVMDISSQYIVFDGDSIGLMATDAGTYTVTFTLKEGADLVFQSGAASVTLTWTIARAAMEKPTADDTQFIENGELLIYMPEGFNEALMNISGNIQFGAGEYVVEVTLADENYVWADGTTDPVIFTFKIHANLLWLIILLSVFFILAIAALIILWVLLARTRLGKSDGGGDGQSSSGKNAGMYSFALMAASPFISTVTQIWICAALGVACIAVIAADIVLAVKLKKAKNGASEGLNSEEICEDADLAKADAVTMDNSDGDAV